MSLVPVLLVAACIGCADHDPPTSPALDAPPEPPIRSAAAALLGRWECTASTESATLACGAPTANRSAGIKPAAALGQNEVELESFNVHYDTSSRVFSFDVTVANLQPEPIGTPDGSIVTGLKVVYTEGPAVTSYAQPGDTGSVVVDNPNGYVSYTRPDQPYHFYDQMLASGEVSDTMEWRLRMTGGAESFSFTVMVFAATPTETTVPAVAPDGTPAWVYADSNMVWDTSPHMSGNFPRDVLWIRFEFDATLEQKQVAIDLVSGEVIGGVSGIGDYIVRIPVDGTTDPMFEALEILESLPQVRFVYANVGITVSHLRPTDASAGWSKHDWELNPDSAGGENWGFERIAMPLGWGCETGDPTLTIGVIDNGFHSVSDIASNAQPSSAFGLWPNESHGTQVASILAARGDNSTQLAGVMWRARLELRDPFTPVASGKLELRLDSLSQALLDLGRVADIVNLSLALYWQNHFQDLPAGVGGSARTSPMNDSTIANVVGQTVTDALLILQDTHGRNPLVVISASNDGIDAYWSGVANAAADPQFADQVIVVGATDSLDQRSSFSNWNDQNNLVSVMAPGEDVATLNASGTIVRGSGALFATPFVTGLAGLLKSFDRRLTAAEIKQLIVDGALAGGRAADGVPIADAYESLKLAARRPGAPLCGSRLWASDGTVWVERDTGPEVLFDAGEPVENLNALHGGRHVEFWDTYSNRRGFVYSNSNWIEADPDTLPSGRFGSNYWSVNSISHEADSVLVLRDNKDSTDVYIADTYSGSQRLIGTITVPLQDDQFADYCTRRRANIDDNGVYRGYECSSSSTSVNTYSESAFSRGAYSPMGGRAFVVMNVTAKSLTNVDDWQVCSDSAYMSAGNGSIYYDQCRPLTYERVSLRTHYFEVNLQTDNISPLAHLDIVGQNTYSLAVAEGGQELLAVTGKSVDISSDGLPDIMTECSADFRDLQTGNMLFSGNMVEDCNWYWGQAAISSGIVGGIEPDHP